MVSDYRPFKEDSSPCNIVLISNTMDGGGGEKKLLRTLTLKSFLKFSFCF
jgi:hypothetical protein